MNETKNEHNGSIWGSILYNGRQTGDPNSFPKKLYESCSYWHIVMAGYFYLVRKQNQEES